LWRLSFPLPGVHTKPTQNPHYKKNSRQVMLWFNGVPDKVASFVLLCIMLGATYTHHVADEPVFVFLVYCHGRHTYTHHVAGEPLAPYYIIVTFFYCYIKSIIYLLSILCTHIFVIILIIINHLFAL